MKFGRITSKLVQTDCTELPWFEAFGDVYVAVDTLKILVFASSAAVCSVLCTHELTGPKCSVIFWSC